MAEYDKFGKIDGGLNADDLRFGIVVSRFNSFITERLLQGSVDALKRAGASSKNIDVAHVPGSFELPLTAKKLVTTGKCDTLEQAVERAGLKGGNKGFEAGLGAIEMAQLSRKIRGAAKPVEARKGRRT